MRDLIGRLAAVSTAALVNPVATAQEGTVTVEGLVWFDRGAGGALTLVAARRRRRA